MKSIIKDIFYGNRVTPDCIKLGEEYFKLLGEVADLYDLIEKDLSEEQKNLFKKFSYLHDDMSAETSDSYFIEGVKIGILLGIEACS